MTSDSNGNDKQYEAFVPKINQFAHDYIDELRKEESRLSKDFPLCAELIKDAIDRIYSTGRTPGRELRADVFQQKPIKLSQNVYLPVKQYPKFNFIGKILGPKGNTLKRLHEETMCSIAVKGRHSMRDQDREEKLRQTNDPGYNHLHKNLFIEIATVAPPAEAYARMAYALSEIRKYIIPDKNDEISQDQYRELMEIDPTMAKSQYANKNVMPQKSVFHKLASLGAQRDYQSEQDDEPAEISSPCNSQRNSTFAEKSFKRTEQQALPPRNKFVRAQPYQRNGPFKAK